MNDFLTNLAERSLYGASGDIPGERAAALRPRLALPFERPDHALVGFEESATVGAPSPWGTGVLTSQVSEEDVSINYHAEADVEQRVDKPVIRRAIEPTTSENIRNRISGDRSGSSGQTRSNYLPGELHQGTEEKPSHTESRGNTRDGIYQTSVSRSGMESGADFRQNVSGNRGAVPMNVVSNSTMNEPLRSRIEKIGRSKRNSLPDHPLKHNSPDVPRDFEAHSQSITRSSVIYDGETSDGVAMAHRGQPDSALRLRQIAQSVAQSVSQNARPAERAKSEQVIEVSIGRIEVRATQPPMPIKAERPRQAPPMTSLDEYLQKRSKNGSTGGGR